MSVWSENKCIEKLSRVQSRFRRLLALMWFRSNVNSTLTQISEFFFPRSGCCTTAPWSPGTQPQGGAEEGF